MQHSRACDTGRGPMPREKSARHLASRKNGSRPWDCPAMRRSREPWSQEWPSQDRAGASRAWRAAAHPSGPMWESKQRGRPVA
eukprot:3554698-Pyramimonas_sp.AAC.1